MRKGDTRDRENPYLNYFDADYATVDGEAADMMIGAGHANPEGHAVTLGPVALRLGDDPLHRPGDRRGLDERAGG